MNHRADSEELREQSIGELLKRLADETATLVRKELELAKVEYAEKGKRAGLGAGLLSGAMVAALLALGAFTAFLVLALDGALPNWAAALIVAALYGIVATVLALRGRERLEEAGGPVPEQTKETIEEDLQWARNRATSAKR
ncbi:MAG TPA: phage holin family protein [Gaiellaceae bacterium]|nr:phage holin family protein [Gaiellaceae bacterium]